MECIAFWQGGFVRNVSVNKPRWNRDNIKKNVKEIYQVHGKETGSEPPQIIGWLILRFKMCFMVAGYFCSSF
jgi:hypothetical protein